MAFQWEGIDQWGNLGKSVGGAVGQVAKQFQQSSAYDAALEEAKRTGARTSADLQSILRRNTRFTPGGAAFADKSLPTFIESAQQFPEVQQPVQPAAPQPVQDRFASSEAFRGYQPEAPAPVAQGAVTPGAEIPVTETVVEPAPSFRGRATGMELLQNPELTDTTDREGLRAAYSAPPVPDPAKVLQRKQELLSSGRAKTVQEAEDLVNKEIARNVDVFNNKKLGFERSEARLEDTLADFKTKFKAIAGDDPDPQFAGMSQKMAEQYALENNADGSPKYTPRVAADKAIQDADKINKRIQDTLSIGDKSWTESLIPGMKDKRINNLRPVIREIKKLGVEEYARNVMVSNNILSPGEASALLYDTNPAIVEAIEKIPKIRAQYSTMISPEETARLRPQALIQAAEAIQNISDNQSLVTVKALLEERGLDQADFNDAYDMAVENGFIPSRLHENESSLLMRPSTWSLGDLWLGKPKNLKQFIANFVGGSKN